MALSSSTFTLAGGAVSDLFAAQGAKQSAAMQAKGLNIQAQGLRLKAQGDIAEAQSYDLASALAEKNKQYTIESTAIQQAQLDRSIMQAQGSIEATVAAGGLKDSGSVLDVLADSARQGAIAHQVLAKQGEITEAGYEEQAKSYDVMSSAARMAAAGEMDIASQTDQLAQMTLAAGDKVAKADTISAGVKGAAAIASLFV